MVFKVNGVGLEWLGHASFKIKAYGKTIYIDPYNIHSSDYANIILITHPHYDHCSIADLLKISKDNTIVICPAECQSSVTKINRNIDLKIVEPKDKIVIENIKIYVTYAYNIAKMFHPKSEKWCGYIIELGDVIIYHSGDTDIIPEMNELKEFVKKTDKFIALLPIGGKFTMDVGDAVKAAKLIKPALAIPMHFGSIIGSIEDAKKFCNLCNNNGIRAKILERVQE